MKSTPLINSESRFPPKSIRPGLYLRYYWHLTPPRGERGVQEKGVNEMELLLRSFGAYQPSQGEGGIGGTGSKVKGAGLPEEILLA